MNGDWRAVPYSEQALLENLLNEFSPAEGASPIAGVYISELSLEGDVVDDRALMTATIAIEVTAEGIVFDVPLRLNQAHVEKISHDGPGRASPNLDSPRDDGLHWVIEGQGTHHLELVFRVPLLRSPAGYQLLLNLPPLPEYLVTRLKLRIPGEQVVRRQAEIVDLQQQAGEDDGTTEVIAEVEGQRLDLVWTARRQRTDTLSSVLTTVEAQRDNEQFLLVGTQVITVEQGEISEVLLQVPSEFTVRDLSLESPRDQTTLTYEPAPDDPGWWQVSFEEAMDQRFTLKWTFERPFPEEGGLIKVDGLEIANAGSTQGEILIDAVDGFTVTWNGERSHAVRRVSLRDEDARTGVWGAFEYRNPPFLLEIEINPISPKTAAQAAYFLHVAENELVLALDVSVQILTGSVREMQIVWPDLDAEQWSILTDLLVTSDGELVPALLTDDGGKLTLTLDQPVTGAMHARLRFSRTLPEGEPGVDLTLPHINATWPARPILFVGEAINVTSDVTIDAEPYAEADPAGEDYATLLAEFAEDRVRGWELEGGRHIVADRAYQTSAERECFHVGGRSALRMIPCCR